MLGAIAAMPAYTPGARRILAHTKDIRSLRIDHSKPVDSLSSIVKNDISLHGHNPWPFQIGARGPKLGNPTVINSLMRPATRPTPHNPPRNPSTLAPYFLLTLFSVMLCTGATTSGTFSITA